jgi:hypothetical protein
MSVASLATDKVAWKVAKLVAKMVVWKDALMVGMKDVHLADNSVG